MGFETLNEIGSETLIVTEHPFILKRNITLIVIRK